MAQEVLHGLTLSPPDSLSPFLLLVVGGEGACLPEAHSQGTWKHNKNTSIPSVKA